MVTFGEKLRRLRIERGMRQWQVAADIGIHKWTMGLLERRDTPARSPSVARLAEYYGVSLEYLREGHLGERHWANYCSVLEAAAMKGVPAHTLYSLLWNAERRAEHFPRTLSERHYRLIFWHVHRADIDAWEPQYRPRCCPVHQHHLALHGRMPLKGKEHPAVFDEQALPHDA